MLNLLWLRSLLAVVERGSFQAAASHLQVAQPTVTQHIQKLEEDLKVQLIRRSRAGCQPTDEALKLLPYAHSLLRLSGRAVAALHSEQCRVGASSNIGIYLLQPHVHTFLQGRDPASLELVIDGNPLVAARLEDGEIDVAVMEWWDNRPGFVHRRWRAERVVLIVPPHHPWAGRSFVSREELARLDLLGGEPGTGTSRLLQGYLGDSLPRPRVNRQLGSTEAVKQAVRAGIGVSLVLESTVRQEVMDGSLHAVSLAEPVPSKDIHVIWRSRPFVGAELPAFAAHLLEPLSPPPSQISHTKRIDQ
jgi:DNA-binding transcriptional LysR family regulator